MLAEKVGEEEYLEHDKDDEDLDGNDKPQGAPDGHIAKAVVVEVKHAVPESSPRSVHCYSDVFGTKIQQIIQNSKFKIQNNREK